jgi:hypothetical protein|tara:strand:+ start:829 stop:957 length:129 start_codon:yes stop_codon:yes gene_type:complete
MKNIRCFFNKKGWDIGIHEPKGSDIVEGILVDVTKNKMITFQ